MASILFDDITFPRELYDPDTFEFVAPVSTLLTFTPHIISQLAKTSEEQQEPIPLPNLNTSPTADNAGTANASASASSEQTSASRAAESSTGGIFSSFKNFATSQGTQRILDNGLYLAGRYMDGSASARQSSYENDYRYDTRSRQSTSSSSNYWFGSSSSNRHDYRDQERQRLRDMEERLRQMERDMRQQSAMARSEVDAQRRERVQLEQELESQKQKVAKLEKEVEQQQKEQEANKKKQQEEEKKSKKQEEEEATEKKKKEAKENKDKDKKESSSQEVATTDNGADAANAVLMATVGVASLMMSLYAAHKASSTYSAVRFHDQLELLIEQCEGVIQSTEAWMSEQFLEVPDQIRQDLKMLKELIETIQRLDPRSEKKVRVSEL
jgi:DNA polymerase III alpha subunit (gram-positive type)